jgi:hypothetical protein
MKRLRKHFHPQKIRYYMCGEYGEQTDRPHYHALLFGVDFPDKIVHKVRDDNILYSSDILSHIWNRGHCLIGEVNFQTAAYVARYILKKINGDKRDQHHPITGLKHYERTNHTTGEIHEIVPEYTTMSRRPGIGSNWINTYTSDVYPADSLIINSHETKPPRYYDAYYASLHPDIMEDIKSKRIEKAHEHRANNTPARLQVREKVKKAQASILKRHEV